MMTEGVTAIYIFWFCVPNLYIVEEKNPYEKIINQVIDKLFFEKETKRKKKDPIRYIIR